MYYLFFYLFIYVNFSCNRIWTGSLDSDQMRSIVKLKVANKRKKGDRSVGLMLNETRQLLNEFYEPYNQELADIMDDDQFLWEPEENDYESMEDKWISIPTIIFLKVKCEWI